MAVDRRGAPTATESAAGAAGAASAAGGPDPRARTTEPIAVDPTTTPATPTTTEGDILGRLLDLNAEHARLQLLYDDLHARYALQKEELARAGEEISELVAAVDKRDARIKVLRTTVRRMKRPVLSSAQSCQTLQAFPTHES